MSQWLAQSWHKIGIALIALERIWERTEPLWRKIEWFERRTEERTKNTMGLITEAEALVKLVPAVTKAIADAKAASSDPAVLQVIADLEAIVTDVKTGLNAGNPPSSPSPITGGSVPPQAAA